MSDRQSEPEGSVETSRKVVITDKRGRKLTLDRAGDEVRVSYGSFTAPRPTLEQLRRAIEGLDRG
jgi:hypothetical protein